MKVGPIFTSRKESQRTCFGEKEEEVLRKFKNNWSAVLVILTAFQDCHALVCAEFGSNAPKKKSNFTRDTYFNTLMHLRNAMV